MATSGCIPVKFQSVTSPNGMIANLYGPVGKSYFRCLIAIFQKTLNKISVVDENPWFCNLYEGLNL